jgi:hypothetical protein
MPILGIMASSISGSKAVTNSYESIATVTVGSGGSSTIDFTSISNTYTHLQIRYISRSSLNNGNLAIRVGNGSLDTGSNYAYHRIYGDGSGTGADSNSSLTKGLIGTTAYSSITSNVFGIGIIDILDYKNVNKTKTIRWLMGFDANGSGNVQYGSVLWNSTSAINTIGFLDWNGNYNFNQYSSFALYGVKG